MKYHEADEVIRWYPTQFNNEDHLHIWDKKGMNMYIHIPFCKGKCAFCPFNSAPINNKNLDEYFSNLKKEIMLYANENYIKDFNIRSLWIGGGTPSAVPFDRIRDLLNLVMKEFNFTDETEITLETNLHDLSEDYIREVTETPISRLSVGVQSFNDKYLKMMGRTYKYEDIINFFSFIRNYNLDISIDIMYRYPGQTVEEVREEMRNIVSNSRYIDHITLYSLILFPKLVTYKLVENGKLPKQPSLETYGEMNNALLEELQEKGPYHQYTAYHYAMDGKENIYNIDRWGFPQKECVSFGPGAFSQVKDYVYCNEHKLEDYYLKIEQGIKPVQSGKKITLLEQISRYLILGTKNMKIDLKEFKYLSGIDIREAYSKECKVLEDEGLIFFDDQYLNVTPKGRTFIVEVNRAFCTENNKNFTQPQYEILDMFEGDREHYSDKVIVKEQKKK